MSRFASEEVKSLGTVYAAANVTADVPIGQLAEGKGEDLASLIAQLRAENAALKSRKTSSGGIKVSPKGALSVYGLGRFPVTLYRGQWERLFGMAEEIKGFITAHSSDLSVKE